MKINYLLLTLVSTFFLITACQKEVSNEVGGTPSAGFLTDNASGDCLPKTVTGVYEENVSLVPDSNFIDVHINVTKTGSYTVYTDTVNGIYFRATGTFGNTGDNTIRLKGNGTPASDGISNFTITYTSTDCVVPVTILPAGGAVDAVFTLAGAPDVCMNYVLAGSYVVNTAMTAGNTVTINVNVTTAGTYNITTATSNGISFSGSGTLAAGAQTIVLTASGMPIAAGNSNFVINAGASSCNFTVAVTGVPATNDYFPRTAGSNWSYQFDGDPDDSLFIRAKPGTVTIVGNAYTIFEATDDAASGFADYGAYRKNGSNYHTYLDLADYFVMDDTTAPIDYIFLKDDVPAGNTWQSSAVNVTISGLPVSFRIVLTVEQKDITVTIGGTAYNNVIVVNEKYQVAFVPGAWTDATNQTGYLKSYYARNIGLIRQDYYYDGSSNPIAIALNMDIRRYQIAP